MVTMTKILVITYRVA